MTRIVCRQHDTDHVFWLVRCRITLFYFIFITRGGKHAPSEIVTKTWRQFTRRSDRRALHQELRCNPPVPILLALVRVAAANWSLGRLLKGAKRDVMCTSSSATAAVTLIPVTTMSGPLAGDFGRSDVRYWHKADMPSCTAHVRYWGQSGHNVLHRTCLLLTQSGHRQDRPLPEYRYRLLPLRV